MLGQPPPYRPVCPLRARGPPPRAGVAGPRATGWPGCSARHGDGGGRPGAGRDARAARGHRRRSFGHRPVHRAGHGGECAPPARRRRGGHPLRGRRGAADARAFAAGARHRRRPGGGSAGRPRQRGRGIAAAAGDRPGPGRGTDAAARPPGGGGARAGRRRCAGHGRQGAERGPRGGRRHGGRGAALRGRVRRCRRSGQWLTGDAVAAGRCPHPARPAARSVHGPPRRARRDARLVGRRGRGRPVGDRAATRQSGLPRPRRRRAGAGRRRGGRSGRCAVEPLRWQPGAGHRRPARADRDQGRARGRRVRRVELGRRRPGRRSRVARRGRPPACRRARAVRVGCVAGGCVGRFAGHAASDRRGARPARGRDDRRARPAGHRSPRRLA